MRSSAGARLRRTPRRAPNLSAISDFTIEPKGPFTLASAARFVAGWPPGRAGTQGDELRLHFLVDDWSGPARVVLRQDDTVVTGTVEADNEARAIEQAARIVSLDHDGTGYAQIEDPIVAELQRASGYLRPVLFHSPYEAAAWSVISARTGHAQAVKLRDALGETFPTPQDLLGLQALQGLPQNKIPRLHGVAQAALEGKLDREPLLALHPNEAYTRLQELPGIGPFYAGLILIRAVGTTDVAPKGEPRLEQAAQQRYGRPLEAVSDGWRPFRTWVSVLMRANA
jgi:DNA-3-methyladenine glycosylase II